MLIAIVHYHLNRGGVTQVIANHLRALEQQTADSGGVRVVVIHGGQCDGWPDRLPEVASLDYAVHAMPGLDYDDGQPCDPRDLAARLKALLTEAGGSPESTVVHVHNHSLGKNSALAGALAELADEGWPLLLQIHDFAEDFRPESYQRLRAAGHGGAEPDWAAALYPQAAHVHYAVLNQRDARILAAAGVEPARLHVLPNPVGDPGPLPPREPARRSWLDRFGVPEDRPLLLVSHPRHPAKEPGGSPAVVGFGGRRLALGRDAASVESRRTSVVRSLEGAGRIAGVAGGVRNRRRSGVAVRRESGGGGSDVDHQRGRRVRPGIPGGLAGGEEVDRAGLARNHRRLSRRRPAAG